MAARRRAGSRVTGRRHLSRSPGTGGRTVSRSVFCFGIGGVSSPLTLSREPCDGPSHRELGSDAVLGGDRLLAPYSSVGGARRPCSTRSVTASAKLSTASWLTASSPRIRSMTGAMRKKKAGMAENE